MVINKDNMKIEEVNSYYHKVRAVVFRSDGKIYLSGMSGTYTLPGGGIEAWEQPEEAIIRELREELGITVISSELQYLGNYQFYHKNFPDFQKKTNRLNEIDLFLVLSPFEYQQEKTALTNREKEEQLKIISIDIEDISDLLKSPNDNPYKTALDEELKILIEVLKERKEHVRKKIQS